MDGDSGDAGGCINEVLAGGDVKPDKLLSAANIIKQVGSDFACPVLLTVKH